MADPAFLFDSPQLAEHGAIFWPDPTPIGPDREAWEIIEVDGRVSHAAGVALASGVSKFHL